MRKAIKVIAIIDVAVCALMAGVAIAGGTRYGSLLIWSGVTIAVIGGMSAGGSNNVQGEYDLKLDQKIPQYSYQRSDEKLKDMEKSYDFGVLMAAAGAVLIAAGLLINNVLTGEI